MIEKAILQRSIRKTANGDFSTYMSRDANQKDIERVLNYAAKKANEDQKRVVESADQ